uniref:Putative LOC100679230 [Nasonia vitripennis] n=1 Tax=Lepeophtheirus salmonis TaxID=72036 RepID=A0A0K2UW65_LEPSM
MDDAFGNLGDISDEQTLERLESLFESSGNFPSLGSPILNDDVGNTSNSASAVNLFGPLETNHEIFSNYNSTTSGTAGAGNSNSQSTSSNQINDNGPGSVSSSSYTQPSTPATPAPIPSPAPLPSPAALPSPVAAPLLSPAAPPPPVPSPVKKSPSPAPTQPQVLYATKSTVRTTSISQHHQHPHSNLILTAPGTVFANAPQSIMQSTGTLQIQLQPNSIRTPVPKPQPQILPKPIAHSAAKMTAPSALSHRQLAASSSLIVNQSGQLLTTSVSQTPILINSLGQVVSGTTASTPQSATPFLIQQPTGNQVFVLRPSAPSAGAATILPTNNQTGTFLLQQPTGPSTVITAQPQVKIITPQGRMQMQQIQTPSGPKLIAVPVGQTLVQTSAGLISTSSNVLAGFSSGISLPQQNVLTTSSNSLAVVSHSAYTHPVSTPVVTHAPISPVKRKKSKKRNNEILTLNSSAPTPSKKPKVVDLGELMKDVGLDLEGFHEDSQNSADDSSNTKPSQILSSSSILDSTPSAPNASGSQLVAQIQQPLPIQGTPNQLQLVQGPDGQFVLQSAVQQPTILTQASLDSGGTLSIPAGAGTQTIIGAASLGTAIPNTNLNIASTALSGSLIGATSLQTLPQRTTLTTTPTLVNSSIFNKTTASIISGAALANNPVILNNNSSISNNNNTIIKTSNIRQRSNNQSNRVPLYEDDRLPPGWYRKVSQRKSGASAGRYEVFIVGPTGKRFRSRNELKAYFEQTGESTLDPDDFDFSTFGSGRPVTLPLSTATVVKAHQPQIITTMTTAQSSQVRTSAIPIVNSNNSLVSIRSKTTTSSQEDTLPTLEPNDTILQTDNSNLNSAPNLLPSVQVPSRTLESLSSSNSKPVYSSQISRETEDADAQISQLLKTLQEEPHKLSIDPEFIQSLGGGDVDFEGSITPPPPQLAPAISKVFTSTTTVPIKSLSSKTFTTTPHQVPELINNASAHLQMRLLSSTSDVAAGTKLKTFTTTSFSSSSNILPQQILQVSRGEMVSNPISINSNLVPSSLTSVPIGGVSTQVRALQNLPSNTRLIRGPNGQYTIQKVQTIELSPEMQQSLREVQSRIQEIEKQMAKSPQDEAELAQLQTRQQRILSLGRPIPTPPLSGVNTIGTSIGMINPGASVSTSSIPQVQKKGCLSFSSGGGIVSNNINTLTPVTPIPVSRNPPILTPAVATTTPTHIHHPQQQTLVTATKSVVAGPSGVGMATTTTPSGTNIPPLTEQQKRIVAHFKQKMASLPPEQQAQFIAANKASLIRRLNFQPSQIHILCSNRINQQQQLQQQQVQLQQQRTQPLLQQQQQTILHKSSVVPLNQTINTPGGNNVVNSVSTNVSGINNTEHTVPKPPLQQQPLQQPPLQQQRPFLSTSNSDLAPIAKNKKIAWVESQVKKDQNEAVNPNIKTPFRSKEDACKRLLRYHVFHELDPDPEKVVDEEVAFSVKSKNLLNKYKDMREKYHYLLLQESMRITTSSEEVMLARLWDSDERQYLNGQKEDFEKKGIILDNLPPVPSSWRDKYIEVLGHPPPPLSSKTFSSKGKDGGGLLHDEGDSASGGDYDEFHSIQNELSRYNNINGIGNTSGSSELFEVPPQKIPEKGEDTSTVLSDEEDFSLKDVCGGNGVDAILGGGEEEQQQDVSTRHNEVKRRRMRRSRELERRGGSGATARAASVEDVVDAIEDDVPLDFEGSYGHKEVDSVQSAINSILDNRIATPDINNIAGLLDSFNDATSDPATESAVNSIPRF